MLDRKADNDLFLLYSSSRAFIVLNSFKVFSLVLIHPLFTMNSFVFCTTVTTHDDQLFLFSICLSAITFNTFLKWKYNAIFRNIDKATAISAWLFTKRIAIMLPIIKHPSSVITLGKSAKKNFRSSMNEVNSILNSAGLILEIA